jgi:ATP-dependent Lon protease
MKLLPRKSEPAADAEAVMSRVVSLFEQYIKLSNNLQYDAMVAAVRVDDPSRLADTIAAHLQVGVEEKQNLLEIVAPVERLSRIVACSRPRSTSSRWTAASSLASRSRWRRRRRVLPQREDEGDPARAGPQG